MKYPLVTFILYLLVNFPLPAQDLAEALRPNVAAVEATLADGSPQYGFAFITGVRNGKLYLATARHVVEGDGYGSGESAVRVQFYQELDWLPARVIRSNRAFDIAVLEVAAPTGLQWEPVCLGLAPARGQTVSFIGRNGEWYVPLGPALGAINAVRDDRIIADINSIQPGTSGAPLLNEEGIIGLIVEDEGNRAVAVSIERVQEVVTEAGRYPYLFTLEGGGLVEVDPLDADIARLQKELLAWRQAKEQNTLEAYRIYLENYPNGEFRSSAVRRIREIEKAAARQREDLAWEIAREKSSARGYQEYLQAYPDGQYAQEATTRKSQLSERSGQSGRSNPDPNMVWVEGGTYDRGCTSEQENCYDDEKPVMRVRVDGFWISKYEVTQEKWREVMGNNPSHFDGCDQCPVESVSWKEVQAFIKKLNQQTGRNYRLPTEAEWEYAARGGKKSRGYQYAGSDNLDKVAWYGAYFNGNSEKKTNPVGQKKPNELGLYDMSGNVWEWCQDVWHDSYQGAPTDGSAWLKGGDRARRVLRGGSWYDRSRNCRVANRYRSTATNTNSIYGFRLAQD